VLAGLDRHGGWPASAASVSRVGYRWRQSPISANAKDGGNRAGEGRTAAMTEENQEAIDRHRNRPLISNVVREGTGASPALAISSAEPR